MQIPRPCKTGPQDDSGKGGNMDFERQNAESEPLPLGMLSLGMLAESRRKRYPALYAEATLKVGLKPGPLWGARSPFRGGQNQVLLHVHAGSGFMRVSPVTTEIEASPS